MKKLLAVLLLLPTLAGAAPVEKALLPLGFRMRLRPMFDVVPSGGTVASSGGSGGGGAGVTWPLSDTTFGLSDDGDPTKIAKFQVSGVTTATTRTFTFPDTSATLAHLGGQQQTPTGTWVFGGGASGSNTGSIYLGTMANANPSIHWNTTQTPDTGLLTTGTLSNAWVIAETGDAAFDFAHAVATDPTLFIHSHNQSTNQWIGLTHDATGAVISAGTGGIAFSQGGIRFFVDNNRITVASDKFLGFSSNTDARAASHDVAFRRLAAGVMTQIGNTNASIGALLGGGVAVASADPLPVPTGNVFHVTGTTTFTNITATNMVTGACFTMIFDGILTATDGGNLKLAGNFVTTADDTLSLCYDGTNYYETARAVN